MPLRCCAAIYRGRSEPANTASGVAAERLQPGKLVGKLETPGRMLKDNELRRVWSAAGEMGYPYGPLFRLLILTRSVSAKLRIRAGPRSICGAAMDYPGDPDERRRGE